MSAATGAVAARRVLLTADELDVLCRLAGDLRLPADFRMEPRRPHAADAGPKDPVGVPGGGVGAVEVPGGGPKGPVGVPGGGGVGAVEQPGGGPVGVGGGPAGVVGGVPTGSVGVPGGGRVGAVEVAGGGPAGVVGGGPKGPGGVPGSGPATALASLRERGLVRISAAVSEDVGGVEPGRRVAGDGVMGPGPEAAAAGDAGLVAVHPSVRANLIVLAAPELLVETRVQVDTDGWPRVIRAAHAVAGMLGASLVRVDEAAAAELSIFPAERLGAELRRVVPPVGRPDRSARRPSGLLPLMALTQLGGAEQAGPPVVAEIVAELRLGAAELSRAHALLAQARGVLHSTVLASPRASGEPARFGQVLWYATAGGWIGVAPERGREGAASVRLEPAEPEDLGAWVAPLVGEALR
jgi:hypothetical protein